MEPLKIEYTNVFARNYNSKAEIVVNRGGSGSSKTWSLCQLFLYRFLNRKNYKLLLTRKTLPSLKLSSYKDFENMAKEWGVYSYINHNKTERTWQIGSNFMHYGGLDDPEKIKSTSWNDTWGEEFTDFTLEDFVMLKLRNRAPGHFNQMFLSFNPIDVPFIREEIMNEDSVEEIISTHNDNPFLPDQARRVLENLKDDNHRKIYLKGEWGILKGLVFDNFTLVNSTPKEYEWCAHGLDFGFTNDPTALFEVIKKGDDIYLNELIYETGLTNDDISKRMDEMGIVKRQEVIADSAEPKSIEELYRLGRNVKGALKGKDSIKHGIDLMKRYNLKVTKKSLNLQKELRSYKWAEDKNGQLLNKPVDNFNHALDAIRYVFLNKLQAKKEFFVV